MVDNKVCKVVFEVGSRVEEQSVEVRVVDGQCVEVKEVAEVGCPIVQIIKKII